MFRVYEFDLGIGVSLDVLNRGLRFAALRIATGLQRFLTLAFSQKCGTRDSSFVFCFDLTIPAANVDLQTPFM